MSDSLLTEISKVKNKKDVRKLLVNFIRQDVYTIDPNYGWTVVKSLYRNVGAEITSQLAQKKREAAVEQATSNYRPSGIKYGIFRGRINSVSDQFKIQGKLYEILDGNIHKMLKLELMRCTEHGKKALENAGLSLRVVRSSSVELFQSYTELREAAEKWQDEQKAALGRNDVDDLVLPEGLDRQRVAFEALTEATLHEADEILRLSRHALTNAVEFESFKVFAKKNPDTVSKWVNGAAATADQLASLQEATAGYVPLESVKKILETTNGFNNQCKSLLTKAAISWAVKSQVNDIMADPAKRSAAIAWLNDYENRLAVAKYLKKKYIKSIKLSLGFVDIVANAMQVFTDLALEATVIGAVGSKVIGILWKATKDTVLIFATAIQEARIERAMNPAELVAHNEKKGELKESAARAALAVGTFFEEYFMEAPNAVFTALEDKVKEEVGSLLTLHGIALEIAETLIRELVKKWLVQIKIDPAQVVTGEDILGYTKGLTLQAQLNAALGEPAA